MVDPQQEHKAKLAVTISHPASASGMIVLSKMPAIFRKLKKCEKKYASQISYMLNIFVTHGTIAHII